MYQSRTWVEKVIQGGDNQLVSDDGNDDQTRPPWKLTGDKLLGTIRDMLFQNGISILKSVLTEQTRTTKVTLTRNGISRSSGSGNVILRLRHWSL
jgi:hypothetical protein